MEGWVQYKLFARLLEISMAQLLQILNFQGHFTLRIPTDGVTTKRRKSPRVLKGTDSLIVSKYPIRMLEDCLFFIRKEKRPMQQKG